MHHNNSEVLAFKKWFVPNTSVRATLNLQPDQDVKKIIPHVAHPLPKNKSISITNNKNMQSFSTSALPYYHPTELVNNCQAGTSTPTKNMDYIDSSVNDLSTESLQRVKKNTHDPQFQNPIFRKDSLSHRQQLPGYNKSTAQLNRFNLRQTTSNNSSAPFIPKHKQPEWLQKIQLYSKTTKSTKMNLIDKISQNQKEQETSPTFQVIHDSPKKNNQDQKLFFRQTLDPQMDRNFGEPKIPSLSPNYFSKRLKEKESKDLSQTKIDKTPKKESKNKTHNMQGGFWKNKAVSPPSKPWPPQKNDLGMSKEISVPPLPHMKKSQLTNQASSQAKNP